MAIQSRPSKKNDSGEFDGNGDARSDIICMLGRGDISGYVVVRGDKDGGGVSFSDGGARRILLDRRSNAILNRVFTPLLASAILPLLGYLKLIARGILMLSKRQTWMNDFSSGILILKRCTIVVPPNSLFS